ncbi:MAG: hypothetical protein IPK52_14440 [Chloroflexi bacterium]|nr:hypothetical protein [Chloroflexota bacterium]
MRAIQLALPDLIIRLDGEGNYVDVHAPVEDDLAKPINRLIGMNIRDILPAEIAEQHRVASEYVLSTGRVFEYEYALEVPSGHQYFDSRLVKSGPNEITSIVRNITEKRRLQEQSEQRRVELALERERRVILERFIQDASHDLRTPITAMTTTGYLLEKYVETLQAQFRALSEGQRSGGDTSQLLEQFFDTIRRLTERQQIMTISANRLKTLVDSMFDIIRLDADDQLHAEPNRLNIAAESVATMLRPEAENRGIVLKFEAEPMPIMKFNSEMIQRALQNLVVNALNYTLDGGTVMIRVHQEEAHAIIDVVDTGIGIPAEHIDNIFQRFYRVDNARTTRTGGSGLGLAIVQRVVELHGGSVEVESDYGKGSTFRMILPIQ